MSAESKTAAVRTLPAARTTGPEGTATAGGRVIHTGQAMVDLVLEISAMPEPGGDTFARSQTLTPGGGFNVMAAAARDGANVVYAGTHGTGPFGDAVRASMAAEGIQVITDPLPGEDTGISIAMVDDTAERTFVSTSGAETHAHVQDFRQTRPVAGDVVYVTGYSLVHPDNREALLTWLPELPAGIQVVVDPSPMVGELDLDDLLALAGAATVWSANARESRILLDRLRERAEAGAGLDAEGGAGGGTGAGAGTDTGADAGDVDLATHLARTLGCAVILRAGAQGALVAVPGPGGTQSGVARLVHAAAVPAPSVVAVDTNGAGDAHCGVLCSSLARGDELADAVLRANVAAAIAVTRRGPATSPAREELDAAVREHVSRIHH